MYSVMQTLKRNSYDNTKQRFHSESNQNCLPLDKLIEKQSRDLKTVAFHLRLMLSCPYSNGNSFLNWTCSEDAYVFS